MAEKNFAGFWVRFFAGLLDMAFLAPILFLLVYLSGDSQYESVKIADDWHSYSYFQSSVVGGIFSDLLGRVLSVIYLVYFLTGKNQATIGKRLMGIYVGNPDGSKLSFGKAFARALASILTAATLGIGFLLVIFTKEKTALHDLICQTRVFHGKK